MARNLEIKARIPDVDSLLTRLAALAAVGPTEIAQDDTFFRCETGRLKLRTFSEHSGELIFYRRANQAGPKESFYLRSATSQPGALRESLTLAYGTVGRVCKHRTLYWAGRTRIHLDRVRGLGEFLELEVVMQDDEPTADGEAEALRLMAVLGIAPAQLLEDAYVDMLMRQDANSR